MLNPRSDEIIRRWYAAWAAGDDPISKDDFKAQCWETYKDFLERFELQRVFGSGNEAMVLYVCHTTNGKTFRNVAYLRLKDGKLEAIESAHHG